MRNIPPKVLKTFERMKKKEPSHIELKSSKTTTMSIVQRANGIKSARRSGK